MPALYLSMFQVIPHFNTLYTEREQQFLKAEYNAFQCRLW